MPRKAAVAAASASDEPTAEPRRSSRIKDQPVKEAPPKKAPAKPRAKKADKEGDDKEDKPKPARGKKRKAEEEPNGDVEGEPAAKKVCASLSATICPVALKHGCV